MNQPALRLTRPGQLPAPATGDDSVQILTEAIDSLARQRTAYWLGDSAVHLHALASLIAQAQQLLPGPSMTPATRNSPGPRSASSSTPPPPQRRAVPDQAMINLTRITGIMPKCVTSRHRMVMHCTAYSRGVLSGGTE